MKTDTSKRLVQQTTLYYAFHTTSLKSNPHCTMQRQQIPLTIIDSIRCENCKKFVTCGPVYCLPAEGKVLCGRCQNLAKEQFRNEVFEILAKRFIFPCIYYENHCNTWLSFELAEVEKHEDRCKFKGGCGLFMSHPCTYFASKRKLQGKAEQVTMPQELLEQLQCKLCYNYLNSGPVFLTESGESVCRNCRGESRQALIRNVLYEKLAGNFMFPCLYLNRGCKVFGPFGSLAQHEEECSFNIRRYSKPPEGRSKGVVKTITGHYYGTISPFNAAHVMQEEGNNEMRQVLEQAKLKKRPHRLNSGSIATSEEYPRTPSPGQDTFEQGYLGRKSYDFDQVREEIQVKHSFREAQMRRPEARYGLETKESFRNARAIHQELTGNYSSQEVRQSIIYRQEQENYRRGLEQEGFERTSQYILSPKQSFKNENQTKRSSNNAQKIKQTALKKEESVPGKYQKKEKERGVVTTHSGHYYGTIGPSNHQVGGKPPRAGINDLNEILMKSLRMKQEKIKKLKEGNAYLDDDDLSIDTDNDYSQTSGSAKVARQNSTKSPSYDKQLGYRPSFNGTLEDLDPETIANAPIFIYPPQRLPQHTYQGLFRPNGNYIQEDPEHIPNLLNGSRGGENSAFRKVYSYQEDN